MSLQFFRNVLRRIFVHNFYLKFIAAILTLALYIWVSEDRDAVVAGFAPVRVIVPEDMVLVSDPIDRIKVTIRGRWSDITRFDPSQLDPITIELTRTDRDTVVPISADMVRVPPGLRVVSTEPNSMLVQLEPEISRRVTIVPHIIGEPANAHAVGQVKVTPQQIVISGPEAAVRELRTVPTESIDVSGRMRGFQRQVRLRLDHPHLDYDRDDPIIVDVPIVTMEASRTFDAVPVVAVNTTYQTEVSPDTTSVTIRGPQAVVDGIREELLRAEIDLSLEEQRPPGVYSKEVVIRNLPPDVTLVRVYPVSFRVVTTSSVVDE